MSNPTVVLRLGWGFDNKTESSRTEEKKKTWVVTQLKATLLVNNHYPWSYRCVGRNHLRPQHSMHRAAVYKLFSQYVHQ